MPTKRPNRTTLKQIEVAVAHYESKRHEFELLTTSLLRNLIENPSLKGLIHSSKYRTKDPQHLHDKLIRKAAEAADDGKTFDISYANLFKKIEDLGGVRLLHLHTKQVEQIHKGILDVIHEHRYKLIGQPMAHTWDFENEEYFRGLGLQTTRKPSMYTSIHYIIKANRETDLRCELQLRTLMEEVWGEVSHTIDYPYETQVICCREQLRALARAASGCTRLVDSIFASYKEHLPGD